MTIQELSIHSQGGAPKATRHPCYRKLVLEVNALKGLEELQKVSRGAKDSEKGDWQEELARKTRTPEKEIKLFE